MHEIMELKERLMGELGEYAMSPKLAVDDVMVIKALTSSIDHLCNIIMKTEEEDSYSMRGQGGSRYSYEGGGQGGSRYAREGRGGNRYSRESGGENRYSREGGNYAREGGNYARGRRGNVRRDSMGRYSRESGYSRADGVEEIMDNINEMMGQLPPNLQQEAQRFMQELEKEM